MGSCVGWAQGTCRFACFFLLLFCFSTNTYGYYLWASTLLEGVVPQGIRLREEGDEGKAMERLEAGVGELLWAVRKGSSEAVAPKLEPE